jgi:hypothetical protein
LYERIFTGFLGAFDGEKDPRVLLAALRLTAGLQVPRFRYKRADVFFFFLSGLSLKLAFSGDRQILSSFPRLLPAASSSPSHLVDTDVTYGRLGCLGGVVQGG